MTSTKKSPAKKKKSTGSAKAAKPSKATKTAPKPKRGKRVLITGASGYIGSALCKALAQDDWCERVDALDVVAPPQQLEKVHFTQMDINDPKLGAWMQSCAPDVVVHLAFILNPIRDAELMRRVNIDGTRNVLEAIAEAGVGQVMVASSGTAYGAWPDNPIPLKETDPIRPHPGFQYAREKSEVEGLCETFMETHSKVVFSMIRPCVVYGAGVDNYLSAMLTELPLAIGLAGYDPPLQFVHEDDVVGAVTTILKKRGKGAFNVAPPDTVTMEETLHASGKRVLRLPDWVMNSLVKFLWKAGIPAFNAPPEFLDFLRYPWVMESARLADLGFEFSHGSRETLDEMLRSKAAP